MKQKYFLNSFIILLILVTTTKRLLAQDDSVNHIVTNQLWIDYNPSMQLGEKLKFSFPLGARTVFPNTWDKYYISPQVIYDWPRLLFKNKKYKEQLIGGVNIQFIYNKNNDNRLEIRPYQGYSLLAPNWERITIKHYLRLEERFQINTNDWVNTFGLRFRYTGSVAFKFQGQLWEYGKGFYVPIQVNLFWNMIGTKQFNDNLRVDFGLGRSFSNSWKAAFLFGYIYSRSTASESFNTNDVVFRLRVYHTIN